MTKVESLIAPSGNHMDAESAYDQFEAEYFGDLAQYKSLAERRERARERFETGDRDMARRMMEMAIVASVTSVRTVTERWDELTREYLRGDRTAEQFAEATRDGDVKAEKLRNVLGGDIPDMATDRARRGDVDGARMALIGRETGDTDDTYLRATKANFAMWLLGYDVVCMDHRIHRATEPVMGEVLDIYKPAKIPAPGDRSRQAGRTKYEVTDVEFWHDELKWSPEAYDRLAGRVVDVIAENTDVPRDRVTQVAFNVGGDDSRTTHADLLRILAGA